MRAAEEEFGEEDELLGGDGEGVAGGVAKLGDAAAFEHDFANEGEFFHGVERVEDCFFVKVHDGVAGGELIGAVDEAVEGEGILAGGGLGFFDKHAKHAALACV